jgi:hypothetical protein
VEPSLEEAVSDAIKEFGLQNVDLSDIDLTYAGPDGRGEHPASVATKVYVAAVEGGGDVMGTGSTLREQLGGVTATAGWGRACVEAGAVQASFLAVQNGVKSEDGLLDSLATLACVMLCDEGKAWCLRFPDTVR